MRRRRELFPVNLEISDLLRLRTRQKSGKKVSRMVYTEELWKYLSVKRNTAYKKVGPESECELCGYKKRGYFLRGLKACCRQ